MKRMVLLPTGSNELITIQTKKVTLTIKGRATHPVFENMEVHHGNSTLKVYCQDEYDIEVRADEGKGTNYSNNAGYFGVYSLPPIFFEQQTYNLFVEPEQEQVLSFWHDNLGVRNKITQVGKHGCLSGSINFGNEIGMSDLVINVDGKEYLRLVIEIFPTKLDYQADYKAIVADVTNEVYNVVFDFLKKTYLGYQQKDRTNNSPVEFFAVLRKIYMDFLKSVDMVLAHPHHVLEVTHQVLPVHKAKRIDNKGIRWIERHPDQVRCLGGSIVIEKALAVKKRVTYDTRENRLTKYILQSIKKRLERFKMNYLKLQREEDQVVIVQIDEMIGNLNRRCNTSFLAEVGAHESSVGISLVFSMAVGYRDLYKYYLMLFRGLDITGDVFNISVKDLAVLYEYWCFIKLNSLMKERYQLVSQDIVKVHKNGLFISLVKGSGSKVVYRNPQNGERIVLSYNSTAKKTPTVCQKPDNVLSLRKTGSDMEYEYIFDAKYKINPALPGTYYHDHISTLPGPQEEDINTMHRYRDAIVYSKGTKPYERTMFGAYVLFPYANKDEYRNHRFYQSIEKVNIGGLPFLPSETTLVSDFLDGLIGDSAETAFERATLPAGIEEKLAKIDWDHRDVLIGSLKKPSQLNICMQHRFYHIPASEIDEAELPIHYITIYQSERQFGKESGIQWYGEVTKTMLVKRSSISEIPRDSDKLYFRFEVKEWRRLPKKIRIKEGWPWFDRKYTNMFLLKHSEEVPELWIKSEEEYRLYSELKRIMRDIEINQKSSNLGFLINDILITLENEKIQAYGNKKLLTEYRVKDFACRPNAVLREISKLI